MILQINGWPGVGKLTVGRIVAKELGGRVLDNHTIYNPAFALTEFKSPAFYDTVRAVRDVAFQRAAEIPNSIPIVMTNAYADTDWGNENWDAIVGLARKRGAELFLVILDCSLEENIRRAQFTDRENLGKLRDPSAIAEMRSGRTLLSRDADHLLFIDNTSVPPAACAKQIISWVRARLEGT